MDLKKKISSYEMLPVKFVVLTALRRCQSCGRGVDPAAVVSRLLEAMMETRERCYEKSRWKKNLPVNLILTYFYYLLFMFHLQ